MFRVAVAALLVLAGAGGGLWAWRRPGEPGVVVRTLSVPAPVVALRPAADGVAVDLRDGRRVGLTLVAGRPVVGSAPDVLPPVLRAGWDDILRLAAHNEGRLDPIVVHDLDGDRTDDWVALETVGREARLLVMHRTAVGPVTVAFLDAVAGRSVDGALPVGLVDAEGTGRPDILVAAADRRVLLRVRLWPGRLDIEERVPLPGVVATALVPLAPAAVAVGLADGRIATIAWPVR